MTVTGPDCSRYQGTPDWEAVRRAGHTFAIIKATEGTSYGYVDWYQRNAPRVEAAGLTLGAYHFLRQGSAAAQARYFVSTVGSFDGRVAVLDVEKAMNGTYPTIFDVRDFATEFRHLVPGHPLVVYTGRWFWDGYLKNPHGADLGPLWHSEYETSHAEVADGPENDRYGGWPGATLWQWTSSGTCPGVEGRCDLNVLLRGTLADLTGNAISAPTPPVPQEDDDMLTVIGVKGDARRPFMALDRGSVIKFTDDPELVATTNKEVWAPKAEYNIGVRAQFLRPVTYVETGDYDGAAVLAKRRAV